MSEELTNPHDQFFRAVFSRLDVARDFLENYLPPEAVGQFDLATLEVAQESFTDENLKAHQTDFLFRVQLKTGADAYIFILLEHKSYADELVSFQLLRYMMQIWEKSLKGKRKKLPAVFPIVFYHGRKKWKVSRQFGELVDYPPEFAEYVPQFSYYLCDLSALDGEKLKGGAFLVAVMLALKNVFGQSLAERFTQIAEFAKLRYEKGVLEFVALVARYYMSVQNGISAEEARLAIRKTFPKYEENIMTNAVREFVNQGIEQGIEQGLQQGLQQGLEIGKKESLIEQNLKMLNKKIGVTEDSAIKKIKNLSRSRLEELGLAIFDFQTRKDLQKWLKENK